MQVGWTVLRGIAGIIALPFIWIAFTAVYGQLRGQISVWGMIVASASICASIIFTSFAVRGHVSTARTHIWRSLVGALVLGGLGFVVGYFYTDLTGGPENPQEPMLGIFITGPLGFAIGGFAGFLWSQFHARFIKKR
jgi:hypothetical protein